MVSPYLERHLRSKAQARYGTPDDFAAYLSDFFVAWSTAVREEEETAQAWEQQATERCNYDMRRS